MEIRFSPGRWVGNQWACISITPPAAYHYHVFKPLLAYLASTYGFELPRIAPMLDGYAADFCLLGSEATLQADNWDVSLAFEQDAVRDQVLAHLQSQPTGFLLN
ncbi:hypothetical protein [Hymenobacter sp. CRA2]|uniref:hypothetical protein n=1 Tax=Hymenobacter sp. CRA2 TaxID=1955620 RepID=UPI00098F16C5|nr:hypothetical protein [Hymenobacter sp. CRA2]OON70047.1 hypothetical protein B0919_04685 [Hymenobacter sp. CRA2]